VLSVEGGIPKFEISISGTGSIRRSLEVTETNTYSSIRRPDGTSYGEAQGVIMTKDGSEVAIAIGRGEGKTTGSEKMRFVGALFFETYSNDRLRFLNHLIGLSEYEVDQFGNYEHKL
jgi:hypothetical protein